MSSNKKRAPLGTLFFQTLSIFYGLVADERKQRNVACSLDSFSEFSLMLSASTGNSAGQNFGTFGNELSESCYILVVDSFNFFCAEYANFLSSTVCAVLSCRSLFSIHGMKPPSISILFDSCDLKTADRHRPRSPQIWEHPSFDRQKRGLGNRRFWGNRFCAQRN